MRLRNHKTLRGITYKILRSTGESPFTPCDQKSHSYSHSIALRHAQSSPFQNSGKSSLVAFMGFASLKRIPTWISPGTCGVV